MKNLCKTFCKELHCQMIASILIGGVSFYLFCKLNAAYPDVRILDKISNFIEISITYFVTVLAFSITSFALVQLVSGNPSFALLQETKIYNRVISLFRDSTIYHIISLAFVFALYFSFGYYSVIFKLIFASLLISLLTLSLLLIKKLTEILFTLLSAKKN